MQLTPRYGDEPVIVVEGEPGAVLEPTRRQHRRLAAALAELTDEQWAHPSRCAGWTNQDVVVHLETATSFFAFAIGAGLRGEPTRFLATFDPVASPVQLVAGSDITTPAEALARFTASAEAFGTLLDGLDAAGWATLAEAPPGHLSVEALVHHTLWDAWTHERDILLPLGIEPDREDDEVAASLRYVAALGPAFGRNHGQVERGRLVVEVTDPSLTFTVDVGDQVVVRDGADAGDVDLVLTGDAVELLEGLSFRAPLTRPVPAEGAWLLHGLAETFDVVEA